MEVKPVRGRKSKPVVEEEIVEVRDINGKSRNPRTRLLIDELVAQGYLTKATDPATSEDIYTPVFADTSRELVF